MQHDRAAKVILRHSVLGEDAAVRPHGEGAFVLELARPAPVRAVLEVEWPDGSSESFRVVHVVEVASQDGQATGCVVRAAEVAARGEWARVGSESASESGPPTSPASSSGGETNGVSKHVAIGESDRGTGGDGDASASVAAQTMAQAEDQGTSSAETPAENGAVAEPANDDASGPISEGAPPSGNQGRSRRKGRNRD